MAVLNWLGVTGDAGTWSALGFDVSEFVAGGIRIEPGHRSLDWRFGDAAEPSRPEHANRVDRVDHVVYGVNDLDAAIGDIQRTLGLELRRRFTPRPGGPEMAFFRAGTTIVEVVASGTEPALWGIAFLTPDLDACVDAIRSCGGPVGDPKPAIQGGRIATVPTEWTGTPVAIMEKP
jgi:catechol 2,3-dioxygenase-like lactoylglutathione lyase family enzyme